MNTTNDPKPRVVKVRLNDEMADALEQYDNVSKTIREFIGFGLRCKEIGEGFIEAVLKEVDNGGLEYEDGELYCITEIDVNNFVEICKLQHIDPQKKINEVIREICKANYESTMQRLRETKAELSRKM